MLKFLDQGFSVSLTLNARIPISWHHDIEQNPEPSPFPSREIFEFVAEMTVAFGPWDSIDCAYDECMELWEDFVGSRFYNMNKSYLTCVQEFISWLETPTN